MNIFYELLNIDVNTLIATLFWGSLTSMILVLSFFVTNRRIKESMIFKYYLIAKVCFIISYFLMFFRGYFPDLFSVNLGNMLLMTGFYFESLILLELNHEKSQKCYKLITVIFILSMLIFNIIEFLFPSSSIRVTVASICVFFIMFIPIIRLLFSKKITYFKRITAIFYFFFLVLLLPRTIYTIFHKESSIFTNTIIQSLTYLSLVLLIILSSSAYLLFMKEDTEKMIRIMGTTDYLTKLSNRYAFFESAGLLFEKNKKEKKSVGIMFFDLDYFKNVNDIYGHSFGDDVLKRIASIIKESLRNSDLCCRYGGEELVIFVSNIDSDVAYKIAKRILNQIREMRFENQPDFSITASVGLRYAVPQHEETLEEYIKQADIALYHAKNTGRDKIVDFEEV